MTDNIGMLLLDGDEIILNIYNVDEKHAWKLLRHQSYDLASGIPGKPAESNEFIETIARILLNYYTATVVDWRVCARNVKEDIIHEVAKATGFNTELLTLQREQELLCEGMLMEML